MTNKENTALTALARQGFRFKKELGQNFIFNAFVLEQMADAAGIEPGDTVIEAGAGAGSLTAVLAERGAKVMAIELDKALIPYLRDRFRDEPCVEIIQGDVMKLDLDALAATGSGAPGGAAAAYKICANLPYNISSAFVTMVFRRLRGAEGGAVMLQKEVAGKVTAQPGQDDYGLLALAAAWYGEAKQVMVLEPAYFTPPPPVDSAVVAFRRRRLELGAEENALWLVIRGLFNQRRKNLLNGLKSLGAFTPANGRSWAEVLESAGIDHRRRPEALSLEEFAAIAAAAGYVA